MIVNMNQNQYATFALQQLKILSQFSKLDEESRFGLPISPFELVARIPDPTNNTLAMASEYLFDAGQRTILFWDVLRKRGNNFFDHVGAGKAPVLIFNYETIIDGRSLERPCNYSLLRILPRHDLTTDPSKRPYVIIDPRAGHGPGIGGFKEDSQIGVAMRAGHPVYFISFYSEPVPDQTLADVANAEALYIQEVARLHPDAEDKPVAIGNCQAGWALAALAALHPDIMGPVILNGAPLSYWAGADGKNPMRYAGGLLGGKWLASLSADLGNGRFDGAHLVANMENLNPANTLWAKQYNLYANVDTEEQRYLEFERWWNGFFLMNADEIEGIVSELFIGNKLETGEIKTTEGKSISLKNIRSPIVVFASWGDNITPPQQALNWIIDVYGHENDIIRNGQTIVYLLHEEVGHLGIFVSGSVAKKEHQELVDTLEMIDDLPPGLYEMILTTKRQGMIRDELVKGDYTVRIETRTVDDIRALDDVQRDEEYFSSVAAVSEINDQLYKTWLSPWVRMLSNETSAEITRNQHPSRLQHYWLSDLNPFMAPFKFMAETARQNRRPVSRNNFFLALENDFSENIIELLNSWRDFRDDTNRQIFKAIYGPTGLGAIFPPRQPTAQPNLPLTTKENAYIEDIMSRIGAGGFTEAVLRIVLAGMRREGFFERRSWYIAQICKEHPRIESLSPQEARKRIREQWLMLYFDEERALQALVKLLPTKDDRIEAINVVKQVFMLHLNDGALDSSLAKSITKILDLDADSMEISAA